MDPEVRVTCVAYSVVGLSCPHDRTKSYGQEIISLLDRVWPAIKQSGLTHDGINRVIYDGDGTVFAGIAASADVPGLIRRQVSLGRHAYWKHIGPYNMLASVGKDMRAKLEKSGYRLSSPMIEVYGHWTSDESKLETETFVALCT